MCDSVSKPIAAYVKNTAIPHEDTYISEPVIVSLVKQLILVLLVNLIFTFGLVLWCFVARQVFAKRIFQV